MLKKATKILIKIFKKLATELKFPEKIQNSWKNSQKFQEKFKLLTQHHDFVKLPRFFWGFLSWTFFFSPWSIFGFSHLSLWNFEQMLPEFFHSVFGLFVFFLLYCNFRGIILPKIFLQHGFDFPRLFFKFLPLVHYFFLYSPFFFKTRWHFKFFQCYFSTRKIGQSLPFFLRFLFAFLPRLIFLVALRMKTLATLEKKFQRKKNVSNEF